MAMAVFWCCHRNIAIERIHPVDLMIVEQHWVASNLRSKPVDLSRHRFA